MSTIRNIFIMLIAACATLAGAQGNNNQNNQNDTNPLQMILDRQVPETYTAGETVTVQISVNSVYYETVTALGLTETIPEGWTFVSMGQLVSGLLPPIIPGAGDSGELGFAWMVVPNDQFPIVFSYIVRAPEGVDDPAVFSGEVLYRTTAEEFRSASAVSEIESAGAGSKAPTITLIGEGNMTLEVGDAFSDPGATARDVKDGDISDRVTTSGDVNADAAGTYTITYNVTNSAGQRATPVRRVVRVTGSGGNQPNKPNQPGVTPGLGTYNPGDDGLDTNPTGDTPPAANPGNVGNVGHVEAGPGVNIARNEDIPEDTGVDPGINEQPALQSPAIPPNPLATPIKPAAAASAANAVPPPPGAQRGSADESGKARREPKPLPVGPGVQVTGATPTPAAAASAAQAAAATSPSPASAAQPSPAPVEMAAAVPAPEPVVAPAIDPAAGLTGIATNLAMMDRSQWIGLGGVVLLAVVIALAALFAWRVAYSPAPRRRIQQ